MPRLTIALVALAGLLAGGLGISLINRPQPLTEDAVRSIVSQQLDAQPKLDAVTEDGVRTVVADALAAQPKVQPLTEDAVRQLVADALATRDAQAPMSVASLDAAQLDPMIESYLMTNPKVLQRMSDALNAQLDQERKVADAAGIAKLQDAIFNDPDHIVVGNPNGDVTLVEMFDYNCTYCRQSMPDIATLLDEDPNLRIILKEFPILSQESMDAAKIAVVVAQSKPEAYWDFHEALFAGRGQVTADSAIAEAQTLGLDPVDVKAKAGTEAVSAVIQKSYDLAQKLDITGTPTFIIGDELIPGAIGIDELRKRIANMRACGATTCPA